MLPSLFILIVLSWIYVAYGHLSVVAGLFYGIKPAITAIVVQAAHRIGSRALRNRTQWAIAAAAFVAIFALNVPFPVIVLSAAMMGYVGGRLFPDHFGQGNAHDASRKSYGAAIIDDHTPAAPHTVFKWSRLTLIIIAGVFLWATPMAMLYLSLGWMHPFTQMGWFFTKAALLTFGGAYAVLPYIYQGAVGHYQWLTPTQMIDGLALGETTPGPLIMVVAFVGFVGGYVNMAYGPDQLFLAGAVAAVLATWFTFLPSFLFILAGGPFIETTHNNINFTAPLTAITAAVVGVILNLALFFVNVSVLQSGSLSVISALAATAWNFVFNKFFDALQKKYAFQRTFLVRAIHAICFETGLIITLIPVAMVMLNLTVTEAFFVEVGLVLFFLPYTMLFNWLYDYLRWTFVGRKRSAI